MVGGATLNYVDNGVTEQIVHTDLSALLQPLVQLVDAIVRLAEVRRMSPGNRHTSAYNKYAFNTRCHLQYTIS